MMDSEQLDRGGLVAADDDVDSATTTVVRRLRIKIKLPGKTASCEDDHGAADDDHDKMIDQEEEEKVVVDVAEDEDEQQKHVCSLCGKGFRSKKALGGHMRVHAQQQHRHDVAKPTAGHVVDRPAAAYSHSSDMEDDEVVVGAAAAVAAGDDENKPIICPICDRDFPSNKALFGHMRCHPERSWRGIQPPPVYSSSSTVSDVNQPDKSDVKEELDEVVEGQGCLGLMVVDLEKDLVGFGWGAKAIRGRAAISPSTTNTPHHPKSSQLAAAAGFGGDLLLADSMPDPEQVDGVQSLILLSRGGTGLDSETNNTRHDDQLTMPAGCAATDNLMNKENKKLTFCGAESYSIHRHDYSGLEEKRGKKRKNSLQVLTAEDDQQEVSASGLTSSNKRFKFDDHHKGTDAGIQDHHVLLQAAADDCGYNAASAADNNMAEIHKATKYLMVDHFKGSMSDHSSPVKKKTDHPRQVADNMELERYKCTTCNKCFSSHQALGGHKSSHNKSRNNNAPVSTRPNNESVVHHPPRTENQYTVAAQCQGQGREAGSGHDHDHHLGGSAASINIHPLHQCNVCFKIYPSGQALGGHKRLHCGNNSSSSLITKTTTPPPLLPARPQPSFVIAEEPVAGALPTLPPHAPSTVVTAPNQPPVIADPQRAATADNGFFKFDLNELPSLEGEEAVAAAEQPQQ